MAVPSRKSESRETPQYRRTFFVTTKTSLGQRLLQSDRHAALLVEVLRSHVRSGRFQVHDFVIMPDYLHLLLNVGPEISVEKAVQFIKGGFSYRVKRELGYSGEVWQRGFSEVRVEGKGSFERHRTYIAQNPAKAGLVRDGEDFPWCFETLRKQKSQGLKPSSLEGSDGTSQLVP